MKRLLDVVLSTLLLVATAPLLFVIGAAIRLRMGPPVLFRQRRVGQNEETFQILKFRTMRPVGPNCRTDADRLTPLGRWLRRTSLDELPSLVNVLRGEMTLVGPRPLLVRYLPYYCPSERIRHTVRPGITGWAQVNGRNHLGWDARLAHDVWYVRNRSLCLDVNILWLTLRSVIERRGIVEAPATVQRDLDEERHPRTPTRPHPAC